MKRITLILLASMLTLGCFAQKAEWNLESNGDPVSYKPVHIEFLNQPSTFSEYGYIVTANFGNGSCDNLSIDADWFFENSNATRNLIGEVKWRNKDRVVFAIQRFYKRNVNYFDLPDYGSFKQVEIVLGPLEYLYVPGPVEE
jgi:hypothetical protein